MAATDTYKNRGGTDFPAVRHFAITPSDTVDFTILPRAIKILTAGNIVLVDEADTAVTYAVSAGDLLPFRAKRVNSTSTTATAVGWY